MDTLLRLHNAAKAFKEKLNSEREQHVRRLDTMKSNYTAVFEQNAGELKLLARLQEILSRLKVQVHSLTTLSETSEAEIEEMLKELEEKLSSQSLPHDFSRAVVEMGVGSMAFLLAMRRYGRRLLLVVAPLLLLPPSRPRRKYKKWQGVRGQVRSH
ncbi:hypothetical protein C3747_102g55 [Trypanosoma cruzi]|uniref:Uncharacterized protein n=1 Tax=Trypanosoma cruzi TaxID=5693 RepID=A0A2V2WHU0_TRYCR|nr:hypothetical protein C3747_102g55 [Trypanosoma cruzi]